MSLYRPLPECLTIKDSEIEGLGLFATKFIPDGESLGISHYQFEGIPLVRTPLGGFYNHSDNPNCAKQFMKCEGGRYYILTALKDIEAGEEITVKYTMYTL